MVKNSSGKGQQFYTYFYLKIHLNTEIFHLANKTFMNSKRLEQQLKTKILSDISDILKKLKFDNITPAVSVVSRLDQYA